VAGESVDTISVETRADGAGMVMPATNLVVAAAMTNFAIARSAGGVFLSNLSAPWMLTDITGSVSNGDLVPLPDGKSAVFSVGGAGSARILVGQHECDLVAHHRQLESNQQRKRHDESVHDCRFCGHQCPGPLLPV